jgi:hypothetical protein
MKSRSAGIAVSFCLVFFVPFLVAQNQSTSELTDLVRNWLSASSKGDREALEPLIDEDFIGTGFGGNILSRADILPAEDAGEPQPSKFALLESTSRLLGNTGIVMGRVAVEGSNSPGPFRFMVVFVRRDQGWKMVAAHLARMER